MILYYFSGNKLGNFSPLWDVFLPKYQFKVPIESMHILTMDRYCGGVSVVSEREKIEDRHL